MALGELSSSFYKQSQLAQRPSESDLIAIYESYYHFSKNYFYYYWATNKSNEKAQE
jgi:hypothetical protein